MARPETMQVEPTVAIAEVQTFGSQFLDYLPRPIALIASLATNSAFASPAFQTLASIRLQPTVDDATLTTAAITKPAAPTKRPAATSNASAAFDSIAIPFKRLGALKKIAPSLKDMDKGVAINCSGKTCNAAFASIQRVSANTAKASIRDRLNAVNAAVNQAIRYRPDNEMHNVNDRWSTARETLARQQGDCEDFAILKMAALRSEGIPAEQMSIVVLFDQKRRFYHAVLSVEVGNTHFILDNMRNQVLADTQLPDYMPLYSIKDGKGYLHGSRRKEQNVAIVTSLDKIAPGEGVAN